MPERPKKPFRQQLAESDAMLAARDRAQQTPDEVRQAFLARRVRVGPVELQPFSLGLLWLFEELKHPFNEAGTEEKKPLSIRDLTRAIYIFADPESAAEALASGVETFDAAAMQLALGIEPAELPAISAGVVKIFQEGLATIPGAGGSNPPATGS